jgi:ribosome-binding ATPase
MIVVYPVEDENRFTDKNGNVLPDAYLLSKDTTAKELAGKVHEQLGKGFLYAIDVRSKQRVGAEYKLRDGDVIKIVSATSRK